MEKLFFFLNNRVGGDYITFKYRYRKQIIIAISILVFIFTITTITILTLSEDESEPIIVEKTKSIKKKSTTKKDQEQEVKVDIKGAINVPGIYSLKTTSRVIDVIEKAGGLTENADTSVINLSKKLTDEMVIIIYTKAEVRSFEQTKEKETLVQNKCNQKDDNALKNDACITQSSETPKKISINTGTLQDLMTLTGIGEAKAKDIISYREKNGPFKSIDDLTKVSGIGENTLAQIKENLTL